MPFIPAIFAAASAATSFIAGSVILKTVVTVGLNVAINYGIKKLSGNQPNPQPRGTDLDDQVGEGGSRVTRCGRYAVARHFVYEHSYGPGNEFLQQVLQVSDFPVTSLDRVWIDGQVATLGGPEHPTLGFPVVSGDFANLIWLKFYDGFQVTADDNLVSQSGGRWTADAIGAGCAYVVATLRYNQQRLGQRVDFLFEGKGAPLYDWRKDDTAGGIGAHRFDDITTWEFSENPVLMAYCYMRGFAINGDLFCGMEQLPSDLPLSRWTVAASICDQLVNSAPRYRAAIGFDCDLEHGDNLDGVMLATGGMFIEGVEGAWINIGQPQAPVATLTDLDLIVNQPLRWQRLRPMNTAINSVSGTFINPDNQWNPSGYRRAKSDDAISVDRRTRDVGVNFEVVPYADQAARLAEIYLSESRFEATASIVVDPKWHGLEPGDWVVWDSHIYGEMTYLITGATLMSLEGPQPNQVRLELQQRSSDIYADIGVVTPPQPATPPAEPVYQQELTNFSAFASQVVGDQGNVRPAIRVSWTAPSDPTVAGAIIEYWVKSDPANVFTATVDSTRTVRLLTDAVVANTTYVVRHVLITDPVRPVTASAPVEVTTLDIADTDITVRLSDLQPDVRAVLDRITNLLDDSRSRIEQLGADVAIMGEVYVRREGESGNREFALEEKIDIARAELESNQATAEAAAFNALTAEVERVDDRITATASSVNSVLASVDDLLAEGLLSIEVAAQAGGGAESQVNLAARTQAGNLVAQAAMFLRAFSDGRSSAGFSADRFIIAGEDGSEHLPIAVENGELIAEFGRFRQAIAEGFTTPNGKVRIGTLAPGVEGIELTS